MNNEAIRLQRICAQFQLLNMAHVFRDAAVAADQEVSALFYRKARVAAGVETLVLTSTEALYAVLRFKNFRIPAEWPIQWFDYQIGDNTTVSFHHNGRVGIAAGGKVVENYANIEDFKYMYDLLERV